MKLIDYSHKQIGRVYVYERVGTYKKSASWRCWCSCGKEVVLTAGKLAHSICPSCGCYDLDVRHNSPNHLQHGDSRIGHKTRLYRIWGNMKARCYTPSYTRFENWGGRGIKVCDEWHDFKNFRDWALSNGYNDALSIDRIDNDGDYEPSNCKWSTNKEQTRNARGKRFITIDGETHCLSEWCEIYNIPYHNVERRINECGWDIKKALTTPIKKVKK